MAEKRFLREIYISQSDSLARWTEKRDFGAFFFVSLNKLLNKQFTWGVLMLKWRHCYDTVSLSTVKFDVKWENVNMYSYNPNKHHQQWLRQKI